MNRIYCVIIASFFLVYMPSAWSIEINRYVKTGAVGNGTSWENACGSIQKAIDDVKRGGSGTVHVAAGTYNECVKIPNSTKDITLLGGYPATGEGSRGDQNKSIIDAIGKRGVCLLVDYFCSAIVIDGFNMKNGTSGISVMSEQVTVKNCTISNCSEAGIKIRGNEKGLLVENCLVFSCAGVGINAGPQTVIRKSAFINNSSSGMYLSGCYVYGCISANNNSHGIHMDYSELYRCKIFNNMGAEEGGGIRVGQGGMEGNLIYGSLIFNNTAKKGGGIYLCSNATIQSCNIVNNSATKGGGIASYVSETLEFYFNMNGSVLWNNKATDLSGQLVLSPAVHVYILNSGIQGGGTLPETDAEFGIIDLSAKNNDLGKPSPAFMKVSSIIGASRAQAQIALINGQDFHLSKESSCIGRGGYFDNLKIKQPWYDLDGIEIDLGHMDMGAYYCQKVKE